MSPSGGVPGPSALEQRLDGLVESGVLTPDQAAELRAAAARDAGPAPAQPAPAAPSTGVLDVLGYLGGALLLGALIFVGFTLWGDLSRAGKTALAVASFVVPAAGGVLLERGGARRGLARVLLALSCFAAGFTAFMVLGDQDLMIPAGVVVGCAAVGAAVLRSPVFLVPAWVGAMGFVPLFLEDGLGLTDDEPFTYYLAAGFCLVGLLFLATGLVLARRFAWTLAGVSGWAATAPLLALEHSVQALLLATAVAAVLFVGVVRLRSYAFAALGCLVVLSIWPVGLYQLLDTALGVALGLVAAGCVLIALAVVLARLRRRPPGWRPAPAG